MLFVLYFDCNMHAFAILYNDAVMQIKHYLLLLLLHLLHLLHLLQLLHGVTLLYLLPQHGTGVSGHFMGSYMSYWPFQMSCKAFFSNKSPWITSRLGKCLIKVRIHCLPYLNLAFFYELCNFPQIVRSDAIFAPLHNITWSGMTSVTNL